jgi:hypothetical protein
VAAVQELLAQAAQAVVVQEQAQLLTQSVDQAHRTQAAAAVVLGQAQAQAVEMVALEL